MGRTSAQTKLTDAKGRITLGESFKNRTMLMERRGDEIVLRLARVIPEAEGWLYENPKALASVRRGLKQAKAGALVDRGPDLDAARKLAERLADA